MVDLSLHLAQGKTERPSAFTSRAIVGSHHDRLYTWSHKYYWLKSKRCFTECTADTEPWYVNCMARELRSHEHTCVARFVITVRTQSRSKHPSHTSSTFVPNRPTQHRTPRATMGLSASILTARGTDGIYNRPRVMPWLDYESGVKIRPHCGSFVCIDADSEAAAQRVAVDRARRIRHDEFPAQPAQGWRQAQRCDVLRVGAAGRHRRCFDGPVLVLQHVPAPYTRPLTCVSGGGTPHHAHATTCATVPDKQRASRGARVENACSMPGPLHVQHRLCRRIHAAIIGLQGHTERHVSVYPQCQVLRAKD